jgi:hypothetical protein
LNSGRKIREKKEISGRKKGRKEEGRKQDKEELPPSAFFFEMLGSLSG